MRIIKCGLATTLFAILLFWLLPQFQPALNRAIWLVTKWVLYTLLVFLALVFAAASLSIWNYRNVAARIHIDDPVFRDWLMDRAWFCRELGFFRHAGENLGLTVEWLREQLLRKYGTRVGLVHTHQALLLALDHERVAVAGGSFGPESARTFVERLVAISPCRLELADFRVGILRDGMRSVEILCDDHRAVVAVESGDPQWDCKIADVLNDCMRESGIQFSASDPLGTGERLYTALDREGIAKIHREMNW